MGESGVVKKPHSEMLSLEDYLLVIDALADLGVTKIRLTGGEPLLKRGLLTLAEHIGKSPRVKDFGITTNGVLLPTFAVSLKDAGVKTVNISLDSLNTNTFEKITRGGKLTDVLKGLEAAKAAGFDEIKINCVIMRNVNDSEIKDYARFAKENGVTVRFIEMMPFASQCVKQVGLFISAEEILTALDNPPHLKSDGVAEIYDADGAHIGLITSVSHKFCDRCNKVRISADGMLLPCLLQSGETDLKPFISDGPALRAAIEAAVKTKPRAQRLDENILQNRDMNRIGG
jgi:cyclic pyranopterin phosphate synthase